MFAFVMAICSSAFTEGITSNHSCSFVSCWPNNWSMLSRSESIQFKEQVMPQTVDQLSTQAWELLGEKNNVCTAKLLEQKPRKATQKNLMSNSVLVKFVCVKRHASEIITISDRSQACRQCGAFETKFLVLFVSFLTWNFKITILYYILSFWNIILVIRP